jgi:hypothetical protein
VLTRNSESLRLSAGHSKIVDSLRRDGFDTLGDVDGFSLPPAQASLEKPAMKFPGRWLSATFEVDQDALAVRPALMVA